MSSGRRCTWIWTTWRFWWLRGPRRRSWAATWTRSWPKSASLPPRQRALALSAAGFVQFAGGDQARARRLLKQSLPMYRQAGDRLGMGLTAAALGHLLAAKHEAPLATDLLEQTLIQLREMADEELTGPERVAASAGCRPGVQFPGPDQARPGRSSPRGGALHRRSDRGPRRGRPVHHPGLALRPCPQPPGPG